MPTLLLDRPDLPLADINLQRYCILDCEPLHDIKGHLTNLFTKLPHIIGDAQLRSETIQLLDIVVPKEKPSGGDYRRVAIRLLALIKGRTHEDICLLMSTIVEISDILYANDNKRNTVTILRLGRQTNRQPGNVLPNVLLRLQARQLQNEMFKAQNHQSNKISQEARAAYKP